MFNLDESQHYAAFDPGDMLKTIRELPVQVERAWQIAMEAPLPDDVAAVERIVVVGMGGSAIGADLLAGLMARKGTTPFEVVRGYALPAHIRGPKTLVIASSYSGNTEETLTAFAEAARRGTRLMAVTTGGKLAAQAREAGFPLWTFDYRSTPRAALGYSFTLLVGLAKRLGVLPIREGSVEEAVSHLRTMQAHLLPEVPAAANDAKAWALWLQDTLPAVFGSGFLGAAARRWKGQFNENAKQWAMWDELPELNHNLVVGLGLPQTVVPDHLRVIFLRSNIDHPRVQLRWQITAELLQQNGIEVREAYGLGESAFAQLLTVIHFGDFVSYYLAALNGADPSPVENITYLKRRLAEFPAGG